MFFLLRVAFWLTIVLALLPSGSGSKNDAHANVGAGDAISAASAAVSDVSGFCERQPEACQVGAQAAVTIGQRAQAGAKMVFDFLSEQATRNDSTSSVRLTAARTGAPPSQNTLTASDLEPTWQGPAAHTDRLPMPRRDPRRKA